MRRALATVAVLVALTMPAAWAQLEADTSGGPLTLPEALATAFAAWQSAFAPEDLVEPTASFAYAPELLGPDTASLTLRWDDGRTSVLVAPARVADGTVLAHEIGLLLGVPAGDAGVMDPALAASDPDTPTAEDVARLRDVRTYAPSDLTRDGVVDFYDLAAFGAAYGSVGINLRADLDGNGRVDDADLDVLRAAYTLSAPSRTPPPPANLGPGPVDEVEEPANAGEAEEPAEPGAPANPTEPLDGAGTESDEPPDATGDGPGDDDPADAGDTP